MIELLKIILSLSLSGTILILLLFVCQPLYQNRLSKRWQYYIWLLVIARLLLPVTLETSLIGNLFGQAERRIEQSDIYLSDYIDTNDNLNSDSDISSAANREEHSTDNVNHPISLYDMKSEGSTDSEAQTEIPRNSAPIPAESTQSDRLLKDIPQTLGILWLIVALLLFVRKITIYQSFVKYVTAGSKPVDNITLLERFGQIMDENHIKGTIDLCINSLVSSPLLIGFRHVCIVLPTTDLSEDDFYYTVLHELTHYKKRDMFYKWLVQLTICLHWFNPFVYLMGYEINRLCELSCDERVIKTLSDKSRKSYGDTLLNAIGTGGSYKDTLASVTLNESKELLKGRLDAIMKYKKISRKVQTVAIFITGLLIGGAVVLGAYAASDTENAPDASSSSDVSSSSDSNVITDTRSSSGNVSTSTDDINGASQEPDYTIQYENGTYYILTDGATEADKPISNVTNGYYHLVLVHKDEYRTFGSWSDSDMENLVRHLTPQCRTLLENEEITQEDVDIIMAAATEIQETYRSEDDDSLIMYNYIQSAYYQAPYIIEIGYNLPAETQSRYTSAQITLSDQSTMPVFFSIDSVKYMSDETAMSAVTALIERLASRASTSRPLEAPYIVSMEYVAETDMDLLAEKYYNENILTYFSAIFLELDTPTQQKYLDRMFEDKNISFFACCIGMFEDADMQLGLEDIVDQYILRAYEEDNIDFFAVLSGMLDKEAREQWLEKCKREGRIDYQYLLFDDDDFTDFENDYFDFSDFKDNNFDFSDFTDFGDSNFDFPDFEDSDFDFLEQLENGLSEASGYDYLSDLEARGILDEYNENDIITINDSYYYQNDRVRLLIDVRSDGSFENSSYNGRGSVDLKLLRDENNKIIRVEYLSTEEADEIIKDMHILP